MDAVERDAHRPRGEGILGIVGHRSEEVHRRYLGGKLGFRHAQLLVAEGLVNLVGHRVGDDGLDLGFGLADHRHLKDGVIEVEASGE